MFYLRGSEKGKSILSSWPKEYIDPSVLPIDSSGSSRFQSHSKEAIADELLELFWTQTVDELWRNDEFFAKLPPDPNQFDAQRLYGIW